MYAVLVAAVVIVGVMAVLNLLLSFAIIRRLRSTESTMTWSPEAEDMPQPGTPVGSFAVAAVDGTQLTDGDFAQGESFVGIVRPGCKPCRVFVEEFERGDIRLPHPSVFFVVVGDDGDAEAYADRLRAHSRVVVTSTESKELRAFGPLGAFPTFLRIEDGVIGAADHRAKQVLRGGGRPSLARAVG